MTGAGPFTPKAVVLVFPGTNGDRDLLETFERAGFSACLHRASEVLPSDVDVVGLPGGFAYGDYWRAGMLASQAPAVQGIANVVARGGLVIGICNGFQILVEAGYLPGALSYNTPPKFKHRWLTVEVGPQPPADSGVSPSPWLHGLTAGTRLRMPMAHGEGCYVHPEGAAAIAGRVPLTYTNNPNGSLLDAAALQDETGRVLGVMPHPERASEPALGGQEGLALFTSAYRWLQEQHQGAQSVATPTAQTAAAGATAGEPEPITVGDLAALSEQETAQRAPATEQLTSQQAVQVGVSLGLSEDEVTFIEQKLERVPLRTELALFAGMWSEHCAYKSTLHLLKTLPKDSPRVLAGPGAHAGVVDVGEGWGVAFKIESHNHPSAVEPYQGAATGVGGILRDIIAQGARPCAVMDSLCFGLPGTAQAKHLEEGVVAGIAGYGNAIGIPNVGGRTVYDPRYEGNPLVNAMAAGLVRHDEQRTACARGLGNGLLYVGAATGRDGILGAAFASEELDDDNVESRPHVQVGDPFAGKKLMEACLSFTTEQGLVACQDLGASGITCGATEMAAAGGVGMSIDLATIPLREEGMAPQEILLSESQERFLFVVDRDKEAEAIAHFRSYGVHAVICGRVVDGGRVQVAHEGHVYVDVPAALVADGAPSCRWPAADSLPATQAYPEFAAADANESLLALLRQPGIANPEPLTCHYDNTVGNRTVRGAGQAEAAVLKLPESKRGFALVITGRGDQCAADPRQGAKLAMGAAARNLACVGAEMVAITDGLNMASPRDPVEYKRIQEVIAGLKEGLEELDIPVTGGNVSLYNESPKGPIPPTPMVGALGLVEDVMTVPQNHLSPGQTLFLLGTLRDQPVQSQYGRLRTEQWVGPTAKADCAADKALSQFLVAQVRAGRVAAAKDSGLGGLGVALAKLAVRSTCGVEVSLPAVLQPANPQQGPRPDWALFGEYAGTAWVAVSDADADAFEQAAMAANVPCHRAGTTTQGQAQEQKQPARLVIKDCIDVTVNDVRSAFGQTHWPQPQPQGQAS